MQPLTPKAFDLLVYLAQRPGHLVDKATLMAELWPDAIVEEANLSFQVSALRKVLDDGHTESIIQTVPTKGYRLVAPVKRVAADKSTRWRSGNRVVIVVAAACLFGFAAWMTSRRLAEPVSTPMRLLPLTTLPGFEVAPSLSPDARTVAFLWDGGSSGPMHLYVKEVGSTGVRRVTNAEEADGPAAWSNDGRRLAFVREAAGGGRIHIASLVDGSERVASEFPATPGYGLDWSPDGKYLAILRASASARVEDEESVAIFLVPVDGSSARQLTWPALRERHYAPSFSPDGRTLAFSSCIGFACDMYAVGLTGDGKLNNRPRRLTWQAAWGIGNVTWSSDGAFVIYDVATTPSLASLWRVRLAGGDPERIETSGLPAYAPWAARSGSRLAFIRLFNDTELYTFRPGQAAERWFDSSFGEDSPQFSPDGRRVVFASSASGESEEIWIASSDGTGAHQLTRGPGRWQGSPRFSPDGRSVAFDSCCVDGHVHVWTISVDGGQPRQLTMNASDQNMPVWSADGRFIYFTDDRNGRRDMWRVLSGGGSAERVTSVGTGLTARPSTDGLNIIYQAGLGNLPLMSVPIGGGLSRQLVPCVRGGAFGEIGRKLYYVACGESQSEAPVRVLDQDENTDRLFGVIKALGCDPAGPAGLAVSPDGHTILYTRFESVGSDLMLIENFH